MTKLIITLDLAASATDSLDVFDAVQDSLPRRWLEEYTPGEDGDLTDSGGETIGTWTVTG
jgi:hypothetical protein